MLRKDDKFQKDWFKVITIDAIRSTLVNITADSLCVRVVASPNDEDHDDDSDCVSESLSSLLTARALMKEQVTTDMS